MDDDAFVIKLLIRLAKIGFFVCLFYIGRYKVKQRDQNLSKFHKAWDEDDFETCLWLIDKYIENKPKDDEGYYYRGAVLKQLGEPEEAIKMFEKAIGLKKDSANAHFELGRYYYDEDQYEKALFHLEEAKKVLKNEPLVYHYLGLTLCVMDKTDEAKKIFKKALKLEKDDKDYLYFGLFCLSKREGDEENKAYYKSLIKNQEAYGEYL